MLNEAASFDRVINLCRALCCVMNCGCVFVPGLKTGPCCGTHNDQGCTINPLLIMITSCALSNLIEHNKCVISELS